MNKEEDKKRKESHLEGPIEIYQLYSKPYIYYTRSFSLALVFSHLNGHINHCSSHFLC